MRISSVFKALVLMELTLMALKILQIYYITDTSVRIKIMKSKINFAIKNTPAIHTILAWMVLDGNISSF